MESPRSQRDGITIDEAFQGGVGEFGRSQQLFFALYLKSKHTFDLRSVLKSFTPEAAQAAWVPAGMMTLVMVFTTLDPITQGWFRCLPDGPDFEGCEAVHNTTNPALAVQKFCELPATSWEWTRRQDSIVSEWGLICEEAWKQQAVNSGFFAGFLVGAGLFGTLSDTLGRKRALLLSLLVAGGSSMLCTFSPTYWMFFAARAAVGVGVAGIGLVGYVLGCEYVGPLWRGVLGISSQYFFVLGTVLLPVVAFYSPNWRLLCFITGGLGFCYCLILPFTPESPRWLLATGNTEDALRVMRRIALGNGTSMPSTVSLMEPQTGEDVPKSGMVHILGHRILLCRMLVQMFCWFSISSTYYGINLMVADLPGSVYMNNAMLALVEVIAYVVSSALVDILWIGRRGVLASSYLIGGVCLIISSLSTGLPRLIFALVAKCGAASAFALIFLYSAELFPTVVRNSCLGVCSQAARVGGITTPLVIFVGTALHSDLFAFGYMGAICTSAGLLLLTQPETLGRMMPDALEDVVSYHPPRMDDASQYASTDEEGPTEEDEGSPVLPPFQFVSREQQRSDGYTPLSPK